MRSKLSLLCLLSLSVLGLLPVATPAMAQDPSSPPRQQARPPVVLRVQRGQTVFGKITAIKDGALEITKPNGSTARIKTTEKTEFRKEGQSARFSDFKVGEMVLVSAQDSGGKGLTALIVAGRTGGGGPNIGPGEMIMMDGEETGKDFVMGEVTAIDPPQITIQQPDNVTQKLKLTEETSLRKGRDSITIADMKVGDHIFAGGSLQDNALVLKNVQVIPPEQWERMQGMIGRNKSSSDSKPNPPLQ